MKKAITYFFRAVEIAYVPSLLILSFIPKNTDSLVPLNYGMNLLFFLVYSFPFYCVFCEIGFALSVALNKRKRTVAEKIIHAIRVILSVGILLTLIDLSDLLYLALALAVALLIFRIIYAVAFRTGGTQKDLVKSKGFWCVVIAVTLAVSGLFLLLRIYIDNQNKLDPLQPIDITESTYTTYSGKTVI